MNDESATHLRNLRDRLEATSFRMNEAAISTGPLHAAGGHLNLFVASVQGEIEELRERIAQKPDQPTLGAVYAAITTYLLARALAPANPKHGAAMERLRDAQYALEALVGFDRKTPYGRPANGSIWADTREAVPQQITVIDTYQMAGEEYVACTTGRPGTHPYLIALNAWHLHAQPMPAVPAPHPADL